MDCVICCEELKYYAKYSCSHMLCYRCAAKLIFLYGDRQCPLCKCNNGKPLFGEIEMNNRNNDAIVVNKRNVKKGDNKKVENKKVDNICSIRDNIGRGFYKEDEFVLYESKAMENKVKELLLQKCKRCRQIFKTKDDLVEHYKIAHSKMLCTTCVENGHQFWDEVVSYNLNTLESHKRGTLNEPGSSGHIYCKHCKKHIFNMEAAKKHCHSEHQLCTVCDMLGIKLQFYSNYKDLEAHYKAKHFCCDNSVCIKNMCYVFAYKSELWTHYLSEHMRSVKLSDIETGRGSNPTVMSLGDVEEADTTGLYRQRINIVTPLVNEPFFPSFATNNTTNNFATDNSAINNSTINNSASLVPAFMDRSIAHQTEYINNARMKHIKSISKIFYNEINIAIGAYIEGTKSLQDMVSEIETGVGSQVSLKILENISFGHKNKEVKDFLTTYRKCVMFPTFKKENKINEPKVCNISKNPFGGFKILDLTKKR